MKLSQPCWTIFDKEKRKLCYKKKTARKNLNSKKKNLSKKVKHSAMKNRSFEKRTQKLIKNAKLLGRTVSTTNNNNNQRLNKTKNSNNIIKLEENISTAQKAMTGINEEYEKYKNKTKTIKDYKKKLRNTQQKNKELSKRLIESGNLVLALESIKKTLSEHQEAIINVAKVAVGTATPEEALRNRSN